MKLVHSILALIGVAVVAGFVVWAVVGDWRSLPVVLAIAAAAGFATRMVVPRDRRARLLNRLSR